MRYMALCVFTALMTGCETSEITSSQSSTLSKLLGQKDVVTLPYRREADGLFLVPVGTDEGPRNFLIDTGATRSAIFKGGTSYLYSEPNKEEFANIYGLIETGQRPIVALRNVTLGTMDLSGIKVAILPKREQDDFTRLPNPPTGLIGMDIIDEHAIYVDIDNHTISFIPEKYEAPLKVKNWVKINLYHNPNAVLQRNLHFFDLRVGNHLMPAVLDTGAEFNIINWDATKIPEIRRLKKQLRETWKVQGAIGTFDPAVRIKVNGMKAGPKRWGVHDFIVMNFKHMDGLGYEDKPLVIAGSKMLGERSFYIDFALNELRIEPEPVNASKTFTALGR